MHNQRFFSYLSLFTFMMVILVTANNYLLMFVGWEGVGVCSYLLVCFWFTRIAANQSSLSAFLTNRVGDCFLTIGMFAILWGFGKKKNMKMYKCEGSYAYPIKKNKNISYNLIKRYSTTQLGRNCYLGSYKKISYFYNTSYYQTSNEKMNPYYVTGFSDAESTFYMGVYKEINWSANARFTIKLHIIDLPLLYKLQDFFGGIGSVIANKTENKAVFSVSKLNDIINVIIPHFDQYPLESAKSIDFLLWKQCVMLIKSREHLTEKGIHKILSFKSAMNLGLSDKLKANFPNVTYIERPLQIIKSELLNPYWVSGFIDGDGSFTVSIESTTNYVNIRLIVGLHEREQILIDRLFKFFNGGRINLSSKQQMVYFTIGNSKDLTSRVLPHFDTYTLVGNKLDNYLIWKKILGKVENKKHLTEKGSKEIKELKSKLNKYPVHIEGKNLNSSIQKNLSSISRRSYSTVSSDLVNKNSNFASYLAGLIEGDGYIGVQQPNSKTKVVYRPKIIIVFNINDKPLAEKLCSELKVGKIIDREKAGHVLLQILAKEEVLKMIHLINGFMRTPKIEALHRAINWINKQDNTYIACLGLDLSPLDSNSWLAGFTDADGSFTISLTERKKNGVSLGKRVQTFFRIEVKQNYSREVTQNQGGSSYFNILTEIAAFLTVNLYTRTRKTENKVFYAFLAVAHNSRSHEIARRYFDRFPLYSSKYLAYKDWCLVQDLHRGNLTKEKLDKIKMIKNNFNSKRKVFNFSHLDSLHFK